MRRVFWNIYFIIYLAWSVLLWISVGVKLYGNSVFLLFFPYSMLTLHQPYSVNITVFNQQTFFYYSSIITIELVSVERVVSIFLYVSWKYVLQVRLECVYDCLVLLPKSRNNYKSLDQINVYQESVYFQSCKRKLARTQVYHGTLKWIEVKEKSYLKVFIKQSLKRMLNKVESKFGSWLRNGWVSNTLKIAIFFSTRNLTQIVNSEPIVKYHVS